MKKFYVLLLVAFTITCLSGCQKLHDYVENHPDADIKDCPIMQINFDPFDFSFDESLVFSYNSFADPVSIIRVPELGTGLPSSYFFKYDKKHRLTDFISMDAKGTAYTWNRYFYENPGSTKIVLDSFYTFPLIVNGVLTPDPKRGALADYPSYDKKGRIIKDSIHYTDFINNTIITVNNYSYNAAGNRTDGGYDSYDDKINIHRTNKIWMFLDRDYSVNNPFVADSYNSIGLPTKVGAPPERDQYMSFLFNLRRPVFITYKCK
jgi:hypothetical protein